MPKEFVHSIKVPRLYKSAAKVIQEVREKGGSLKSLIYNQRHPVSLFLLIKNRKLNQNKFISYTYMYIKNSLNDYSL